MSDLSDLAAFVIVLFWVGGIAALENAGVDVKTVAFWGLAICCAGLAPILLWMAREFYMAFKEDAQ